MRDNFNIIRFTPTGEWYYPESVELGILAKRKNYTPHTKANVPVGASRVGGPIIDMPGGIAVPDNMRLAAQLNLSDFMSIDPYELLPKKGYLYFFIGGFGDEGKVIYSNCDASFLERRIFEHENWFWDGCLIERFYIENENLDARYESDPEEGRIWSCFADGEKSKIYGVYTHCQKSEKEILEITDSSRILLLQIGEDFTGDGVWSVLIERDDLKALNFGCCSFEWGQS